MRVTVAGAGRETRFGLPDVGDEAGDIGRAFMWGESIWGAGVGHGVRAGKWNNKLNSKLNGKGGATVEGRSTACQGLVSACELADNGGSLRSLDSPMTEYAVDSHAHVYNPARFAFNDKSATYVPHPKEIGTPQQFLAVLDAHRMSHGLLINPMGGYGSDNRCLLDAIASSKGRFKGVAVVDPDISDTGLRELQDGGVVGARFGLIFGKGQALLTVEGKRLLARLKEIGWFAQIHYEHEQILPVVDVLKASGIGLVFDHCGRPDFTRGIQQAGFQALLDFGRRGNAAVKLSGAFRWSLQPWPHADGEPYVRALIEAYGLDNCVWGSDWPFVRVDRRIDYGPLRALVDRWLPDAADRHKVLWETPQRWFGFQPLQ